MTPLRLALGWSAAVLLLCSVPSPSLGGPEPPVPLDKVAHVVLFLGVGWLWMRAAPGRVGAVVAGGIAFGIGIELWQGLLPFDRAMEAGDVVADAVGLGVGVAIARVRARGGERPAARSNFRARSRS